jgi:hypothetical protein
MTTTYTVAFSPEGGFLIVCIPDSDDLDDALRHQEETFGVIPRDSDHFHVERGLTLTDTLLPGDEEEVVWQDDDDLIGEDGDTYRVFKYAVRR